MKEMTENELLAIIEQEGEQAIGADDESVMLRAKMLDYYHGEARHELSPPDVDGRSRVVSKDMMDTIEWMMPSFMHLFAGSDDAIRFEPTTEQDERAVKDASDYVSFVFWRKNPGFRVLHDAIKNSLMQRVAYVKVYAEDYSDQRVERYSDMTGMDLQIAMADPDVEVLTIETAGDLPGGQDAGVEFTGVYDVSLRRKESRKNITVSGVPPEELRFNKTAISIEAARFVEHRPPRVTMSDLRSRGYDEELLSKVPQSTGESDIDEHVRNRDDWDTNLSGRNDEALREVDLREAYIKVDYDGDGIAEFRRVVYAGQVVLENDVVDDHPFALFSPILMPYKAIGLGVWDLCEDLMRIRTVLTRQMLDNAYKVNDPRQVVVEGQVKLDDLLNNRPGGIVRTQTLDSYRPEPIPFIGGQALTMLDHFGQIRDKRTGVTEFNQGLGADALSKTQIGSEGAVSMMESAMQRIELIARVYAETALSRVWQLLLKESVQNADRSEEMKVNGRWLRVNPREWRTKYSTVCNIGVGTSNRNQKIGNLMKILELQREASQYGLAGPENAHSALVALVEAMGYKDTDRFFTAPQNAPKGPEQPPIELMLEQMKQQGAQQLEQVKAQTQIEVERMKQEYQAQDSRLQKELELERDRMKLEMQKEIEMFKATIQQGARNDYPA